jgi:hypothetical protein
MHIYDLSQENWRQRILFKIASVVVHLVVDEATKKQSFEDYA